MKHPIASVQESSTTTNHPKEDKRNRDNSCFTTTMSSQPLPTEQLTVPKQRRTLSSAASQGNSRNSSLWAEDYFDSDTEVGSTTASTKYETEVPEAITPPPAAATTSRPFPRSVPISADEDSYPARQTRTHQRSLTALLPFLPPKSQDRGNSKSPERKTSPKKERTQKDIDDEFMATLTGDKGGIIKVEDRKQGGLAGWFTGSSAPVAVGIPIDDPESLPPKMPSSSRDVSPARRRPTLQTFDSGSTSTTQNKTPAQQFGASRFNFFSSPKSPPKQSTIQLPTSTLQSDELLTLDINAALFPSGAPSPDDTFSPSAYKNLILNAEGTLLKFQTAYKLRTLALHELSTEHAVQEEELEEAETRAQALKSQLEDMARRLEDQDHAMSELLLELAQEKQARAEEKEARERSITLVRENRERIEREGGGKRASCCANHGEEDLGISSGGRGMAGRGKKQWRRSNGSGTGDGESESEVESVFSRSMSPTYSMSETASTMTNESSPEIMQASIGRVVVLQNMGLPQRPKMEKQQSTFQKILTGVVNSASQSEEKDMGGMGMEDGCKNCMGKESSVAWDAVGLLRAENKGLKDRVGELEKAVDGALDLCVGLRL